MKPIYLSIFLFAFVIWSCGEEGGLEPGQAKINVEDTGEAIVLKAASPNAGILPGDGQSLIIIEDLDTAKYVVADGDTLALCDAVYHDPAVAWGEGKQIVVVKGPKAYCLTVVANKDGSFDIQQIELPIDPGATVAELENGDCGVRNMSFDEGENHDFDFTPGG